MTTDLPPTTTSNPDNLSGSTPPPADPAQQFAPKYPNLKKTLTSRQVTAIELLTLGRSDSEVSQAFGADRSTIRRWRLLNPFFIVELDRRRDALLQNSADRLKNLLPRALSLLQNTLDSSDARLAFRAAVQIMKAASSRLNTRPKNLHPDQIARDYFLQRSNERATYLRNRDSIMFDDDVDKMLGEMVENCDKVDNAESFNLLDPTPLSTTVPMTND